MELGFIADRGLREKIENAVEYIYTLYEESKKDDKNDTYRIETYRVIVLYTISIIEALLFYIYEQRGVKILKIEYKEKVYLPQTYINQKVKGKVLFAIERSIAKTETEIGLQELVQFLETKKILKTETVTRILESNSMRNSFHFRKKDSQKCTVETVESALELLVYVFEHVGKFIKQT